jgi:hypothetical protein
MVTWKWAGMGVRPVPTRLEVDGVMDMGELLEETTIETEDIMFAEFRVRVCGAEHWMRHAISKLLWDSSQLHPQQMLEELLRLFMHQTIEKVMADKWGSE